MGPLLLLLGCDGSLLGPDSLENLLGIAPEPTSPAWQLRWYAGPDEGLVVDCTLEPTEVDPDDIGAGVVVVVPPERGEPPVWIERREFRWALALPVLVDAETYAFDGEDDPFDNLEIQGVWGITEQRAWLFWEGDADAVADDLVPIDDEFLLDQEASDVWVGFLPEVVEPSGDPRTGLFPLDEEEQFDIIEEGMLVRASTQLRDRQFEVWTGEALGGFSEAGCP